MAPCLTSRRNTLISALFRVICLCYIFGQLFYICNDISKFICYTVAKDEGQSQRQKGLIWEKEASHQQLVQDAQRKACHQLEQPFHQESQGNLHFMVW